MRLSAISWDFNKSHRSTVLLAGVGRSGTTWLSNLINHRNEYRVIFEPFHPHQVKEARCFEYLQYLRPDEKDAVYQEKARLILTGSLRNPWTDSENRKRFSSKRLVKEIRANLMLKWLHNHFPGMPIILLLRHPCAVANSWLQLNWGNESGGQRADLDICFAQRRLVEDHLHPFLETAASVKSPFEKHVLLWCLLNYVPLRMFRPGELCVVFYERLCVEPEAELRRLFAFLGKPWDGEILKETGRPSSQSRSTSEVTTGGRPVEGWKKYVPPEWSKQATLILEQFGLDTLYSDAPLPRVDALETLQESLGLAS